MDTHLAEDLVTGAADSAVEYRSLDPDGKAMPKAAAYLPPHEEPSEEYPFQLTTSRSVHHFHTRTKTGRAPQLNAAAPDVWVEVSVQDAERTDLREGDPVEVHTPRGALRGRLRVTGLRPGALFVPFRYGYGDTPAGSGPEPGVPGRAANETTITEWAPRVQAAGVQDRRGLAHPRRARRRDPVAGTHHRRLGPGGPARRTHHCRRADCARHPGTPPRRGPRAIPVRYAAKTSRRWADRLRRSAARAGRARPVSTGGRRSGRAAASWGTGRRAGSAKLCRAAGSGPGTWWWAWCAGRIPNRAARARGTSRTCAATAAVPSAAPRSATAAPAVRSRPMPEDRPSGLRARDARRP
ncbi:hypothetical protein GCM10017667_49170 [Streptomyces filamentosus]|uniref:Molybdopterin dinucleotide-binding domain-containing protein n=1 Tax=Streptomyces filamentosus TaxID=67294 RepID=A0A919EPG6_STRFL|nr:hypothetical protein GCM10017667_49170 [Streptomyces filamentosus]